VVAPEKDDTRPCHPKAVHRWLAMVEFQRIERAARQTTRLSRTDYRLKLNRQHAHRAGIIFIEQNGDGPGVRITGKSKRRGSLRLDQLNAENDG
jgi:hypothetical protein